MPNYLKVGIAGYGVVGKRRRQFIDSHLRLKTVAVCDRIFEDQGKLEDGTPYFSNYEDLLSECSLDILFVCLTNDVAPAATIEGLSRGLHVFCEKPPGRDLEDMRKVLAAEAKAKHLKLKYGFNHRYHDSVREALCLLESKDLGKLINIRGVYGKSQIIAFGSTDWRAKRAIAGGGILLDQGIHMVDMMRLFAGEFSDVHSYITNDFWNYDVEDNAYALMRAKNGVIAMLHSTSTEWRHRFRLEMGLEKGSLILAGILSGSKSYGEETLTVAYRGFKDGGVPREQTTRFNEDNSWRDEIFEFTDLILGDKPVTNGSSNDAMRTMELVYRIYCADPEWKAKFNLCDQITTAGDSI